ncbi:MAG: M14 family zinc carboxypeptidase [bacterium]|nr:M14 family zinc carboxypeptidase [bacterium]
MPPLFTHISDPDHFYHVTPDEIDQLAEDLNTLTTPALTIDVFPQHIGRNVYALTFNDPAYDRPKQRIFISRPHAHEPAGTAACTELVKTLAGYSEYANQNTAWREYVLKNFIVTLVPDANPGGSQHAPVKFWDGSEVPNERFFLWMFGESGETPGERFPRVDTWDMRKVTPPALLGVAYEQIDEHTYVEPNRDYRSTFFSSFFECDKIHHYDAWLDLHQTEFVNSDRNCQIFLPLLFETLPESRQAKYRSLGEAIHTSWKQEGAAPFDHPQVPYKNNPTQRDFLARVWGPIDERMLHLVTEVQNNNLRTPISTQVRLQLAAILETISWLQK